MSFTPLYDCYSLRSVHRIPVRNMKRKFLEIQTLRKFYFSLLLFPRLPSRKLEFPLNISWLGLRRTSLTLVLKSNPGVVPYCFLVSTKRI